MFSDCLAWEVIPAPAYKLPYTLSCKSEAVSGESSNVIGFAKTTGLHDSSNP